MACQIQLSNYMPLFDMPLHGMIYFKFMQKSEKVEVANGRSRSSLRSATIGKRFPHSDSRTVPSGRGELPLPQIGRH
jgi:hypothetical protein